MKHLKISGNIVIDDESLELFKDEVKELFDKYSITQLSRSAKITVTQNLSTYRHEKYKVGSVFKLELLRGIKINVCYFVFISTGKKEAIALILTDDELNYVISNGDNHLIFDKIPIQSSIQHLYYSTWEDKNYLINKIIPINNKEDIPEIEWYELSVNLEPVSTLDKNIIANIIAQFRGRNE